MIDPDYISKNRLKQLSRLKEKKHRDSESLFIVEGLKNIRELLDSEFHIIDVLTTETFLENNLDLLENIPVNISLIPESGLKNLADTVTPQGIFALAEKKDESYGFESHKMNKLIYLDHISDPGNLAAVFRNAAWFGFDGILLSPDSVDVYSPKVIRGSAGAVFHIPFRQDFKLDVHFEEFATFTWIGADAKSELNLDQIEIPEKFVLCLGNESRGLSHALFEILHNTVRIPSKNARIESLNLAIASAVIMYEMTRTSK